MSTLVYPGEELDLFAQATHWKSYLARTMTPYLGEQVLEVGAGIGATTEALCRGAHRRWLCLEPDSSLASRIEERMSRGELPACCELSVGTVANLPPRPQFDTILYVDVLEHIEADRAELAAAARRLRPGGHLVVLAPAHPWLFTAFDEAIGHYRRYSKKSLLALSPPGLQRTYARYLDSVGLLASMGNRLLLRSSTPSRQQVQLWDRLMVPLSGWTDVALAGRLGKSVLVIWTAGTPASPRSA